MDASDEIVPGGLSSEFFDPTLVSRNEIAFTTEANRKIWRTGGRNHLEVKWELFERHSPIVETGRHRVMVGETDFGQSRFFSRANIVTRVADCVTAKRRMQMVVSAKSFHPDEICRL